MLWWTEHCIVKYKTLGNDDVYFDPSYGSGPFLSLQALNNSLGGFSSSFTFLFSIKNQHWYSGSGGLDIRIR